MESTLLAKPTTRASPSVPVVIPIPPRTLSGASLSHLLTGKTPVQRGFVGADLHVGRIALVRLTVGQAVMLTGANPAYLREAAHHDPTARRLICAGVRPMRVPKPHSQPPAAPSIQMSDDELLVGLIRRVGIDHVIEIAAMMETAAAA